MTEGRDEKGRFKRGHNATPNNVGRPKSDHTITSCLRNVANTKLPDGRTNAQALAEMMWNKALAGDRHFVEMLTNRLEGTPKQFIEQRIAGPITIDLSQESQNLESSEHGNHTDHTDSGE